MAECVSKMCSAHQAGLPLCYFFWQYIRIQNENTSPDIGGWAIPFLLSAPKDPSPNHHSPLCLMIWIQLPCNHYSQYYHDPMQMSPSYKHFLLSVIVDITDSRRQMFFFSRDHEFRHTDSQMGPCLFLFFIIINCKWVKQL